MAPLRSRPLMMGLMTDERSADIIPIDEHAALCLAATESGSPLLPAIVNGTTLEKLVASVEQLYGGWPERLSADVDQLLDVYTQRGLMGPNSAGWRAQIL